MPFFNLRSSASSVDKEIDPQMTQMTQIYADKKHHSQARQARLPRLAKKPD
jgi:hypothetical protein